MMSVAMAKPTNPLAVNSMASRGNPNANIAKE